VRRARANKGLQRAMALGERRLGAAKAPGDYRPRVIELSEGGGDQHAP
jgi:hypothetical protein